MSLNIKAEPQYPSWWVPRDSHAGQTISWTTNLFACTFMLVAAQYTSAVWAVSSIKARRAKTEANNKNGANDDQRADQSPTTSPTFRLPETMSQRIGLGIVLSALYAIQVWLCWPSEICPLDGSLSDAGQVITSCYPAVDMLKSLVFVLVGPVMCFIYCWLVWSPSVDLVRIDNDMNGKNADGSESHTYSAELQLKASSSTAGASDTDSSSGSSEDRGANARTNTDVESQGTSKLMEILMTQNGDTKRGELEANNDETGGQTCTISAIATNEDDAKQNKNARLEEKLKKMLPYINNLKVFMTWYVITAHTAQVLLGMAFTIETPIDSVWDKVSWASLAFVVKFADVFLMTTFFFLSGYFSPRALRKRGPGAFLFERAKRLAIPFSVFAYVFFPYVLVPLFMMPFLGRKYVAPVNVTGGDDTSLYLRVPSVMWFLFLYVLVVLISLTVCRLYTMYVHVFSR